MSIIITIIRDFNTVQLFYLIIQLDRAREIINNGCRINQRQIEKDQIKQNKPTHNTIHVQIQQVQRLYMYKLDARGGAIEPSQ